MSDGENVAKRKDGKKSDEGPRLASPPTFIPAEEGDLESALGVLDYIEVRTEFVRWESYKVTSAHHQWLAHILLYRCWNERRNGLGIDGCCHHSSSTRSIPGVTPLGRP